jgi:hypothetical protein
MSQIVPRQQSDSKMSVDDLQILCGICDEKSAILVWYDKYSGFDAVYVNMIGQSPNIFYFFN